MRIVTISSSTSMLARVGKNDVFAYALYSEEDNPFNDALVSENDGGRPWRGVNDAYQDQR